MYRVIIVDDENWVMESLKARINWNEHGFQVIGQASNGIEACEIIQRSKPDLVFTDIRMPGMGGLDLIKTVSRINKDTKFIVISGYPEFEYAQKAMNSGAVGYCLKPFNEKEIISLLNNIKLLWKSDSSLESRFFDFIEINGHNEHLKIVEVFNELGLRWDGTDEVMVVISIGAGELKLSGEINIITLKMGMHKRLHFVEGKNPPVMAEKLKKCVLHEIKSIGIGRSVSMVCDMNAAFEEASLTAYQYFVTGRSQVYEYLYTNQKAVDGILMRLEKSISDKDIISTEDIFKEIDALMQQGVFTTEHAFRIYRMTMYFLYKLTTDRYEENILNYEQMVESFGSVHNMIKYLNDFAVMQMKGKFDFIKKEVKSDTLKSILKYINQNFWKNISTQSISQEFFINHSYMCQLIKKETGKTFTEYLSELRINHACENAEEFQPAYNRNRRENRIRRLFLF